MDSPEIIRPAIPTDASGIARVHVASWRSAYPGVLPDKYLVGLSAQSYAARWRALLTRDLRGRRTYVVQDPKVPGSQGIVGFGSCGPQRTALPGYTGEFYAIYLHDTVQGRGLGRRLMAAMAVDMLGLGTRSAVVWVLRDNPSRWFYERLGGTKVAEQPTNFAGIRLDEVAYGWHDLAPLARQAADPEVR